jgi:uncharacterized protein involved in outer membrane biogenesis
MKKLLVFLASLIVVIPVALVIVPKVINWHGYITVMVKDLTGREVRIDGDVRVTLIPNLAFSATDVHLANAPGAKAPEMVSVAALSGNVRLLPLIGRRLVVDSLIVRDPVVNLELNKDGRANWAFETADRSSPEAEETPSQAGIKLPIKDLSLGEVRLSGGRVYFANALTGQTITAEQINLGAGLANLRSPLTLVLRMQLNDEPVNVDISMDAPQALLTGRPATVKAVMASTFVTADYTGAMQQAPVPGLSGAFNLDIPSVGQLAAWLDRPLDASQPDPGLLKVRARFQSDGAKVVLTEATIEGSGLQAKATGSYDGSGDTATFAFHVESDQLDIDRYLPQTPVDQAAPVSRRGTRNANRDILAVLSPKPLNLKALRDTEGDVRIAIRGINAMGLNIKQVDFIATLQQGLLTADLRQLALYGGHVNGKLTLDSSGDTSAVKTFLNIDRVKVDQLTQAVTRGETPVTGIATGTLEVTAQGTSPRSLIQSAKGGMTFHLRGVEETDVPVGAISELKMNLDLPGFDRQTRVNGYVVYNQERVNLDLKLDSIHQVLSGTPVAVTTAVDSKRLTASLQGTVQPPPAAGLDGTLSLDIPSVARFMIWIDQPLDQQQPDPGPLKLRATLEAKGSQASLKQATIEGKALLVHATGKFDQSGSAPMLTAKVHVAKADLNAYLPPPNKPAAAPPKQTPVATPAKSGSGGWRDTSLDLATLKRANAEIVVEIESLHYRDLTIEPVRLKAVLNNGVSKATKEALRVSKGSIDNALQLDASGSPTSFGQPVTLRLEGAYRGETFQIDSTIGSLTTPLGDHADLSVALTATLPGTVVKVDGILRDPLGQQRIDLNIDVKGKELRDLESLIGQPVTLRGPFRAAGHVVETGAKTYQISDIQMALGANTLAGSLKIDLAEGRPRLAAVFTSPKLDLRPLMPSLQPVTSARKPRVFPQDPLPLPVLKLVDGTANLRIDQLMLPQGVLHRLTSDLRLHDGHLTVQPVKAVLGGGALDGRLDVRTDERGAAITAAVAIEQLDISRLLKELGHQEIVAGKVDVDVDIKGRGNSVAAVMGTLNGSTKVVMGRGRIDISAIDLIGADFATSLIRLLDPFRKKRQTTELNCFVSRFDIDDGLARSNGMALDTRDTSIIGEGTIKLKTEKLNLSLKPSPKKGVGAKSVGKLSLSIGELSKPFKLGGTLAAPKLAIDPAQTALLTGKTVGGVLLFGPVGIAAALLNASSSDKNPCLTALNLGEKNVARSGTKKSQPTKVSNKAKPGGLKGLGADGRPGRSRRWRMRGLPKTQMGQIRPTGRSAYSRDGVARSWLRRVIRNLTNVAEIP